MIKLCTDTQKVKNIGLYLLLSIAYSQGDWSRGQHHGLTAQRLKCRQRNHGLRQCLWSTFLPVPTQNGFLDAQNENPQIVLRVHKKVIQKDNNEQLWQQPSGAACAGLLFKLKRAHKKGKKQAGRVKENPVRCEDPTNCPREEWKWEQVRRREGGRGEEEKRNSSLTLLSVRHRAPGKLLWLQGLTPQCPFNYCS